MSFGYQILGFGAGSSAAQWLEATGGVESTYTDSGTDYKAHVYLSDSTFICSALGADASAGDKVDYYVIGGGGGSCGHVAAGGGGGGAAISSGLTTTMTVATHPITVGGGAASAYGTSVQGIDSVVFVGAPFAATGTGGGRAGSAHTAPTNGAPGGCGGGGTSGGSAGTGSQGQNGSGGGTGYGGGGGGMVTAGGAPSS